MSQGNAKEAVESLLICNAGHHKNTRIALRTTLPGSSCRIRTPKSPGTPHWFTTGHMRLHQSSSQHCCCCLYSPETTKAMVRLLHYDCDIGKHLHPYIAITRTVERWQAVGVQQIERLRWARRRHPCFTGLPVRREIMWTNERLNWSASCQQEKDLIFI